MTEEKYYFINYSYASKNPSPIALAGKKAQQDAGTNWGIINVHPFHLLKQLQAEGNMVLLHSYASATKEDYELFNDLFKKAGPNGEEVH